MSALMCIRIQQERTDPVVSSMDVPETYHIDIENLYNELPLNYTGFEDSNNLPSRFEDNFPSNFTLDFDFNERLGNYLVDSKFRSVYHFSLDHIGTGFTEADFQISCYDQCAIDWPPVLATSENSLLTVGFGLNQSLIGSRMRTDGTMQLTYNNIPLYYYREDSYPGDILGHNLFTNGGYWYLVNTMGLPIM